MKIRTKLINGFLFISLLAASTGYYGFLQLKEIAKPLDKEVPSSIEQLHHAAEMDRLARYIRYVSEVLTQSARNYAFTCNIRWKQRYNAYRPEFDHAVQQAKDKSNYTGKPLFKRIDNAKTALLQMERAAIEHINGNHPSLAIDLLESDGYWRKKRIIEGALRDYFLKHGIGEKQEITVKLAALHAQGVLQRSITVTSFLVIAIIVLSVTVGILITRSIAHPLQQLTEYTEKITHGDLTQRIKIVSDDEIVTLSAAFNQMTENLQKTTVSKKYVDGILDSMMDTLLVIDSNTIIQTVNRATLNLLEYDEKELIGRPIEMIFGEAQEVFKKTEPKTLFENGLIKKFEGTYLAKTGERIPVLFNSSAMRNENNKFQGILCVALDITERKHAEAAIQRIHNELTQRVRELDKANEELNRTQTKLVQTEKMGAIGKLAAGVAHEMNNPLSPVLTYAMLMKGKFESAPEPIRSQFPKFSEWFDIIVLSAERCKTISDSLLLFARQSEGEMTKLCLSNVVSKTLVLIGVQLRHRRIKLINELEEGLTVLGDANQLQQVFTNLIMNAADAIDRDGEVTIRTKRVGKQCEVSISDTGPGIPPEILGKIFDPFFTTKSIGKGTGLGLSIVHGIMQIHEAEITVESKLEKGTAFYIKLPIYEEEDEAWVSASSAEEITLSGSPHILVVDDEELILKSIKDILENRCKVDITLSPETGLQMIKTTPYEIILTDLMMNEMNGMDFVDAAIKIRPNVIPIIMTGYRHNEFATDKLKECVFDLIEKPFIPDLFKHTIYRAYETIQTERKRASSV